MNIAGMISRFRMKRGLNPKEFAERGMCSEAYVRQIEAGKKVPSVTVLDLLVRGAGSSLAEFFGSTASGSYANPDHAALHDKLQDILETEGDFMVRVRVDIEAIHEKMLRHKSKDRKSASGSPVLSEGGAKSQDLPMPEPGSGFLKASTGKRIGRGKPDN
jgi:transcriptional regulator with XRE-family HTH domain